MRSVTLDGSGPLTRQPLVLFIATNPIAPLVFRRLTTTSSRGVVPQSGLAVEGIARPSPAFEVSCLKVQGKANGLAPSLRAIKEECEAENYENCPRFTQYARKSKPKGRGTFTYSIPNPFHHLPPYVSFHSCFPQEPALTSLNPLYSPFIG